MMKSETAAAVGILCGKSGRVQKEDCDSRILPGIHPKTLRFGKIWQPQYTNEMEDLSIRTGFMQKAAPGGEKGSEKSHPTIKKTLTKG